jgi:hypothetical protein
VVDDIDLENLLLNSPAGRSDMDCPMGNTDIQGLPKSPEDSTTKETNNKPPTQRKKTKRSKVKNSQRKQLALLCSEGKSRLEARPLKSSRPKTKTTKLPEDPNEARKQSLEYWKSISGQRQAKSLIAGFSARKSQEGTTTD